MSRSSFAKAALVVVFTTASLSTPAGDIISGQKNGLSSTSVEDATNLGLRVVKVRMSAAGRMIDVRYWVDDPDRSWEVLRSSRLVLEHLPTGARLNVPTSAFIGPLSQIDEKPKINRQYFILFANRGGLVKPGDEVMLHLGGVPVGPFTVGE
jgi:hypothetical protein